jgi:hypothetical protein
MKKKKILLSPLMMLTCLYASAQVVTPLNAFEKVEIKGTSKVTLKIGESYSITQPDSGITGKWKLEGSKLVVDGAAKNITLQAKNLQGIEVSGTGSLTTEDTLRNETIQLVISGSGNMSIPVVAKNISVEISGVGKMTLSGQANNLNAEISGSGKLSAHNLQTTTATVTISGTGNASVETTDSLNVIISGTGKVYYKTTPKTINQQITGLGKLAPLSESTEKQMSFSVGASKPKKAGGNWAGLDIGFNGLYNKNSGFDTPSGYDFLELIPEKSIAVNLNLFEQEFKLYKRYVLASTGIGLSYNNYRFRKNISLIPDTNRVTFTADSINLRKNKLTVSYLTIPVLLTFNTSEEAKKAFHITTGLLFSYKLGSHTKQVYTENGHKKKDKVFDDFNIDPLRYDATLRIGYREFTAFANYSLTNLFKNNRGPELQPWTVGISLVPF